MYREYKHGLFNLTLPILMDEDGTVAQMYGIRSFPTTFIIQRDGTVYGYIPGKTDKETIMKYAEQLK